MQVADGEGRIGGDSERESPDKTGDSGDLAVGGDSAKQLFEHSDGRATESGGAFLPHTWKGPACYFQKWIHETVAIRAFGAPGWKTRRTSSLLSARESVEG